MVYEDKKFEETPEELIARKKKEIYKRACSIEIHSTYELVEELKKRAGVEVYQAEPYEDKEVKVNGPAQILVVVD